MNYYMRGTIYPSRPFYLCSTLGEKVYVLVRSPLEDDNRLVMVGWEDGVSEWIPMFATGSQSSGVFLTFYDGYPTSIPRTGVPLYLSYQPQSVGNNCIAVYNSVKIPVYPSPIYNIPNIMATGINYTLATSSGKAIVFNVYESLSAVRNYSILSTSVSTFRIIPYTGYSSPNCSLSLNNKDILALEVNWNSDPSAVPKTFTEVQQCSTGYLYDYCEGQNTCSDVCYGICSNPGRNSTCVVKGPHNITCVSDPLPPPPNWELLVGIVILIIVIFFIICFLVSRSSQNNHPTVSSLTDAFEA